MGPQVRQRNYAGWVRTFFKGVIGFWQSVLLDTQTKDLWGHWMNKDLLFVSISLFAWGIGESAYRFFQPLYLEQLGASPVAIGTILGGVGIAMTAAHIPAGYLADRFGPRLMMWAAWILGVVSGIFMAFARTLPVFTTGVILYGITAFVFTPMNSYITSARGRWSVGRAITVTSSMYNLGAIIGPFLGGIIGDNFGYNRIYLFATGIFVISTIFIFLIQPPKHVLTGEDPIQIKILNPRFLGFLPIIFISNLGMYLSQPLAPNFLQSSHNLNLSQIGSLGSVSSIGSVMMMLLMGSLNPGLGFILGQLSTGFFSLLLWGGSAYPWFVAGFFLLGGYRSARAMSVAFIRNLITTTKMGMGYGIAETVTGLAVILASVLAGYLFEIKPPLIFTYAMGITLISIIITYWFISKFYKHNEEA